VNLYERVMIFVDGSNVFKSIGNLNRERGTEFRIDYLKLRDYLANGRNLVRTYYYGSENAPSSDSQRGFISVLRNSGFEVCLKPLRTYQGDDGRDIRVEKGIDIALATDLVSLAWENAFDTAVIVSGDSDFLEAIRRVKQKGRKVEIVAFNASFSADMKTAGDRTVILDDILDKIRLVQSTHEGDEKD